MTQEVQPLTWQKRTNLEEHQQFFAKINEIVGQLSDTVERSETALEEVAGYNTRLTSVEVQTATNKSDISQLDAQSVKLAADHIQVITGGLDLRGTNRAPNTTVGTDDTQMANGHRVVQELAAYQPMVRTTGNQNIEGTKTFVGTNNVVNIRNSAEEDSTPNASNTSFSFLNKIGKVVAYIKRFTTATGNAVLTLSVTNQEGDSNQLVVRCDHGNVRTVTTAQTPEGSTDGQVITANALNSWASVVHTVGNEEISGNKSFSGSIIFNNTAETGMKDIVFNFGADKTRYGLIRSEKGGISTRMSITAYNKNNLSEFASIVVGYDTNGPFTQAPTTPSNANGNEIATAGWVKNTINSTVPVTKNTLIINSVETLKQALDLMRNGAIGAIGLRLNYKGNALGCTITGFNAHLTYGTYKYGITGGYHSNIETKTFHELVHWYESNPDKLVIYGNYDGELVIGADITIDSGKYVYFE